MKSGYPGALTLKLWGGPGARKEGKAPEPKSPSGKLMEGSEPNQKCGRLKHMGIRTYQVLEGPLIPN